MWPLSEDRFRELLEALPAVFYADSNEPIPRTLYLSGNATKVLGADAETHLEDPDLWWRSIHPDDLQGLMEAWHLARETEQAYVTDYRYRRPDGVTVWLREHAGPVRDDHGAVMHWQGVLLDVTSEHEALADLRDSEQRHRSLVEQVPALVYAITDEDEFQMLYASAAGAKVLGYAPDDPTWLAMSARDIIHADDRDQVLEAWRHAVATGEQFDMTYRQVGAEGRILWVHDRAVPIYQGGRRSHWQGVVIDITTRVEAERALEASEARRRALIENLPAVVYEMAHDDDRRPLFISSGVADLLGTTHHEWLDQPDIWTELLHPDDREVELAAHDLHSKTGEPWSRDYRLVAADGRVVWVRDVARLVTGPSGAVWQGVFVDISAQKEAEEALRRVNDDLEMRVLARTIQLEDANELMSLEVAERRRVEDEMQMAEERFRHVVEQLPAVIYRWEVPDGVTRGTEYVSPWVEHMLGYAAEDWRTKPLWRERLHPHDRERVLAAVARTERSGEPFEIEYRYLARDGHVVWVFDRATLLHRSAEGDPATFQGVMIDLTDRKVAERRAAEAEERFRGLIESGPVVSYAYHLDPVDPPTMVVEYVSPQMADTLGFPLQDFAAHPQRWFEIMHPDDRDRMTEETLAIWQHGAPWKTRYRMIRADGRVVWLHDRGRCTVRDQHGRPQGFHGTIMEITAEVEAEGALRARVGLLEEVVSEAPAVLWRELTDHANGGSRYVFISAEAEAVFGYTPEELTKDREHFPRLVHPDDRERVDAAWTAAQTGAEGRWEDEYRVVHRSGSVKWVQATGRRVTPPGTDPAVWQGATLDVTHRHSGDEAAARLTDAEM